jgi:hypothetical protein
MSLAGLSPKTFMTQPNLQTGQPAIAILQRAAALYCIFAINGASGFRNPNFWALSR